MKYSVYKNFNILLFKDLTYIQAKRWVFRYRITDTVNKYEVVQQP